MRRQIFLNKKQQNQQQLLNQFNQEYKQQIFLNNIEMLFLKQISNVDTNDSVKQLLNDKFKVAFEEKIRAIANSDFEIKALQEIEQNKQNNIENVKNLTSSWINKDFEISRIEKEAVLLKNEISKKIAVHKRLFYDILNEAIHRNLIEKEEISEINNNEGRIKVYENVIIDAIDNKEYGFMNEIEDQIIRENNKTEKRIRENLNNKKIINQIMDAFRSFAAVTYKNF